MLFVKLVHMVFDTLTGQPGYRDSLLLLLIYKCRVSVPNNQLGLNPLIVLAV